MLGGSNLYITHLGNRQGTTRRQLHITQTQSDHRNTCSHYHKRANMSTFENGTLDTEFNGGVNTRTALWGETIWRTHTEMHSPFCTTILYYTTNLIYWLIDIYIFLCVCVCVCVFVFFWLLYDSSELSGCSHFVVLFTWSACDWFLASGLGFRAEVSLAVCH